MWYDAVRPCPTTDATVVKGYEAWRAAGRHVNRNEKASRSSPARASRKGTAAMPKTTSTATAGAMRIT
jgi:hypothetical protein